MYNRYMSTPILATKLYVPPSRPNLVLRSRLIERLNDGVHRKLTLISAPAGFGKSTLASDWISGCARQISWLSLDERDSDFTRFLTYFVAALQKIEPKFGEESLALLHAPQAQQNEAILTTLLNEITTITDNVILVLDDYHLVALNEIDDALTFLLDHLPPQMHLVITTREDPNLPLARYRGRGQLTEVRAADLRFTPDECARFLNESMGLTLSAKELSALETRTEGWITGLQLAALSVQGRVENDSNTVGTFIQAFAGSHHFILDYLIEEVLQHQSEDVRDFLLHTSILERLSGALCDAVTGSDGKLSNSQGMLESLEHDNLFVIPLDEQRQWYRYHHLFADVLLARLQETQPELVATLHQRASAWYAQNNLSADAIRHAFAAEDFAAAAGLIELAWRSMDQNMQYVTWLGWVKALPDELVRSMPVLSVGYAWALLDGGELEASKERLQDAERWLNATSDGTTDGMNGGMIVVDEAKLCH